MRAGPIVQQRLRTPTGPFFARFFIGIILGLVAEFAFIRPSTRLMMSSFAARWMGRKQNVGWKFQHGCSTGWHALTTEARAALTSLMTRLILDHAATTATPRAKEADHDL